jgi:hypothetical protein
MLLKLVFISEKEFRMLITRGFVDDTIITRGFGDSICVMYSRVISFETKAVLEKYFKTTVEI